MDAYDKEYPIDPIEDEGIYDDIYYYDQMQG